MLTRWSANQVDPHQQSRLVQESLRASFCFVDVGVKTPNPDRGVEIKQVQLGQMILMQYAGTGLYTAKRSMSHIRSDHADDYLLYVPLSASVRINQDGHSTRVTPGTFAFVYSGKPFAGEVNSLSGSASDPYASVHARIPASLLRDRLPSLDRYPNQVYSVRPGASAIMVASIKTLLAEGDALSREQSSRLCQSLLDVVGLATEEAMLSARQMAYIPPSMRALNLQKVKSFIDANLSNHRLNTLFIAEQCGISLRYLHACFNDSNWTVASWIKEQRLVKCRAALRSAEQRNKSVTEIAYEWGFNDSSHFSRAYKRRFGVSPVMERK
ncbi:MAG: helix-turn-helix domain-containing protein [Pseudomonadales bacterium]|nr:helix-turn-helix domain-containing protein [Pseudomonadales bacterium]